MSLSLKAMVTNLWHVVLLHRCIQEQDCIVAAQSKHMQWLTVVAVVNIADIATMAFAAT